MPSAGPGLVLAFVAEAYEDEEYVKVLCFCGCRLCLLRPRLPGLWLSLTGSRKLLLAQLCLSPQMHPFENLIRLQQQFSRLTDLHCTEQQPWTGNVLATPHID